MTCIHKWGVQEHIYFYDPTASPSGPGQGSSVCLSIHLFVMLSNPEPNPASFVERLANMSPLCLHPLHRIQPNLLSVHLFCNPPPTLPTVLLLNIGQNPTKFLGWLAYTIGACKKFWKLYDTVLWLLLRSCFWSTTDWFGEI